MLIDGQTIITGSFNFTTNAEENNAENLLIIQNRADLYQAYEANFRHHYEHSQPYQAHGSASSPAVGYQPGGAYPAGESSRAWNDQWPQASRGQGPAASPTSGF